MTYYQRNTNLMQAYKSSQFERADAVLNTKKWQKQKRNVLLYYLNKGTVLHMLGEYEASTTFFQKADYYIEDYHKNYGIKALSYLSNPATVAYSGENYEKVLLHYYNTLNYLNLNNLDEALVECKRMLLTMENISTYFKSDNKLHQDAFAHLLLGIVYDAKGDYNNAFIAYRNAYAVYEEFYVPLLGSSAPLQLQQDLLRTAYLSGLYSEVKLHEEKFNVQLDKDALKTNTLVCFWNNGMCPVKEQGSITFLITNMGNGYAMFTNIELGLTFPFYVGNDAEKMNGLTGMKFLRVSYPKFISQPLPLVNATVYNGNQAYSFQQAEDIDAIAQRTLKDRMAKEIGGMLLRLAIKKIAEAKVRESNQGLAFALNIANTLTEQADTRNWQLLPSSINYSRVPLQEGENVIKIKDGMNAESALIDTLTINSSNSLHTYFHSFTTLQ
jgi:uncharacterized protein